MVKKSLRFLKVSDFPDETITMHRKLEKIASSAFYVSEKSFQFLIFARPIN